MLNRIAALTLTMSILTVQFALATERSQQLTSRGLVELNAAHYSKALQLLDQAVAADDTDVYAHYYRAVARSHLKDNEGAIADLRMVLAAKPDLQAAALDLGVALIETQKYRDALPWLKQAQSDKELSARASLFLGLAQLRLRDTQEARENFQRAAESPKERLAARYYEGVAEYQSGNWSAAKENFAYVVSTDPDSAVGREAAAFLAALGRHGRRRYQLYAGTGFQYDTNVILAPSGNAGAAEEVLGVSQKGDGRTVFTAGGTVVPWQTDTVALSLGYDFFQSIHIKLREFDLQDHAPSLQLAGEIGRVRLGVLGRYDYYLLDSQSFLQQATAFPWLSVALGNLGRTDFSYDLIRRDYKQRSFSIRDAFHHALGVRQFFYLGSSNRYLSLGYQFDREDPVISQRLVREGEFTEAAAKSFAYDSDGVDAGVGLPLPLDITTELNYSFRHEVYVDESRMFTPSGNRRRDNEHLVVLAVRKELWSHVALTMAYLADFNGSNDPRFDYDRHIVSLALEGRM
jgi:tetratricopeptide (TPR) repeat protein